MASGILIERDGAIATVTLSNPGKLNALDRAMWEGLANTMRQLSADETLRCVVLRGAGDEAFAAGADIAEFASERATREQGAQYGALIHDAMQSVARCRHPVIALIKGACVGGGLEIAAMCDLRICGESSRFGVPIKNLGLTMGYGELQGVLAVAGRAVVLEILLEGRVFGAQEASAKRLVNRVVADAAVEREAYATAARIAAGAPLVARWHKQYIERLDATPEVTLEEWNEGYACFDSADYKTGVAAFLVKTKPQFEGH
ncbi:MAG: enoyl-CoA hydratase-related protein [Betaproteobacteria bacterium]